MKKDELSNILLTKPRNCINATKLVDLSVDSIYQFKYRKSLVGANNSAKKSLLLYRILVNCNKEFIDFFLDENNFDDLKIKR